MWWVCSVCGVCAVCVVGVYMCVGDVDHTAKQCISEWVLTFSIVVHCWHKYQVSWLHFTWPRQCNRKSIKLLGGESYGHITQWACNQLTLIQKAASLSPGKLGSRVRWWSQILPSSLWSPDERDHSSPGREESGRSELQKKDQSWVVKQAGLLLQWLTVWCVVSLGIWHSNVCHGCIQELSAQGSPLGEIQVTNHGTLLLLTLPLLQLILQDSTKYKRWLVVQLCGC